MFNNLKERNQDAATFTSNRRCPHPGFPFVAASHPLPTSFKTISSSSRAPPVRDVPVLRPPSSPVRPRRTRRTQRCLGESCDDADRRRESAQSSEGTRRSERGNVGRSRVSHSVGIEKPRVGGLEKKFKEMVDMCETRKGMFPVNHCDKKHINYGPSKNLRKRDMTLQNRYTTLV